MPARAPPAFRKFKPIPVVSAASGQTAISLPLPPAPLELKLTASATQSMHLASVHSSESSASQTDQQYANLLVRWREFLSELGAASALYSEACASQNRDFLLDRAARKFAPSTLLRYFDAWLNWSSFCRLADAAPHDPPPGLLPDWLKSQSSRQGLATMQLRALAWFVKTAGLPKLKACLCTPICQAFAVASNPQEHRESLPLSLSFVLHLEKSVLDPLSSPAEVLRLGYLLLCIWGSLRWGDALWCPPTRLHYQPQSHALVGICLRTKTTKRGMPFGVLAAGLPGTTSQCWSLRFLSVLRQSVADTLAINPHRHLDFLPAALSGSETRPIISAPLKRERSLSQLIACPRLYLPALACLLPLRHRLLILRDLQLWLNRKTPWSLSHLSLRIHLQRRRFCRMNRPRPRPLKLCLRPHLPLLLLSATSGTHAATWSMWPCERSPLPPAPSLFFWTGPLSGSDLYVAHVRTNWTLTASV